MWDQVKLYLFLFIMHLTKCKLYYMSGTCYDNILFGAVKITIYCTSKGVGLILAPSERWYFTLHMQVNGIMFSGKRVSRSTCLEK
jgi:hypothetical protein